MFEIKNRPEVSRVFEPLPYEVDFTGFLSNTVAPKWMEHLRVSLMRDKFQMIDITSPDHLSLIYQLEVKYIRPVRFGDKLIGAAWIDELWRSRWKIGFSFTDCDNRNVVISGFQHGAFIDPVSLCPIGVPKEIVKVCNQTVEEK